LDEVFGTHSSKIALAAHILRIFPPDLTGLFWTKRCERIAWKGAWVMPKKRFSAEQIVTLLRQIEVSMAQENPTPVACRDAGISLQNYAMSCSTAKSSIV